MSYRTMKILFISLAISITSPWFSLSQPSDLRLDTLSLDQEAAVRNWLQMRCGVGDYPLLASQLDSIGTILSPVFQRAYELGISDEDSLTARTSFEFQNDRLVEWLQTSGIQVMGEANTARLLDAAAENGFVEQEMQAFINSYKNSAIAALSIVGDPSSPALQSFLDVIRFDDNNPSQQVAQLVFERLFN